MYVELLRAALKRRYYSIRLKLIKIRMYGRKGYPDRTAPYWVIERTHRRKARVIEADAYEGLFDYEDRPGAT